MTRAPAPAAVGIWCVVALVSLHVALLGLVLTRQLDFLFNAAMHRNGPGTDFAAYYVAGGAWLRGESIYGLGPGFGYRYHPLFAMTVGAALSRLDFAWAYGVWVGINEVLLAVDLVILRRLVPDPRRYLFLIALGLTFTPYYLEVYMGNASIVAASLLLIAGFLDGRGCRAAVVPLVVASIVVKPVGLVLLPLLFLQRRGREAALIVAVVALLALPYLRSHGSDWRRFVAVNVESVGAGWAVHAGNQGLHALLTDLCARLHGIPTATFAGLGQLPASCRIALAGLPILLVLVTARTSWLLRDRPGVAVFLWSAVYVLGYKDVWEHSYSFLLLGLGCLAAVDYLPRWLVSLCAVGLALPTAFALYDVPLPHGGDPEHVWALGTSLLHHATKPIWVTVLYAACVLEAELRVDAVRD